jgi:tetratricopeptide (TPR) repeat protein
MKVPESDRSVFRKSTQVFTVTGVLIMASLVGLIIAIISLADDFELAVYGTPTPTRTSNSYLQEAQALFNAGNTFAAIDAYSDALESNPENVQALADLARLQVYSSRMMTDQNGYQALLEAYDSITLAVELEPENSYVQAVYTLVLDWLATSSLTPFEDREGYLADAAQAANYAVSLDSNNALALAFRAEVLADQLRFDQAFQLAEQAVELDPNLMDTHRVFAYVLESTRYYSRAIEEYKLAAEIMPNMTFLYISIGQNYRQLNQYDQALDYFDQAATINATNGVEDPLPYLGIAKTYTRMGEFFAAAINAEKALSFDYFNPDLYGQLGYIRFQARNYEGSIPMLECAVEGCEILYDEFFGVIPFTDATDDQMASLETIQVPGLDLSNNSLVYYYVYGSVLAAFDRCDEAAVILDQVEASYGADELIMGIVNESRQVCRLLGN